MVGYYPLSAFGENRVAASIDTPLHAFLPFPHVDHLHPDWAIALAASANGKQKLEEFNRKFGRKIAWVPWQRPGFELALLIEKAVKDNPGCDGLILGSHGLFTWGADAARVLSEQHSHHRSDGRVHRSNIQAKKGALFGGLEHAPLAESQGNRGSDSAGAARRDVVESPRDRALHRRCGRAHLRGLEVVEGTGRARNQLSGPFPAHQNLSDVRRLESAQDDLNALKDAHSGAGRQLSRRVQEVLRGLGHAGFAEAARFESFRGDHSRRRAIRFRQEQEGSAHHDRVLHQCDPCDGGRECSGGRRGASIRCRRPGGRSNPSSSSFFHNYVALPRSEAFRIEYWALEEAKLQRMPAEAEFSRKIALVVGGGSGVGREVALLLARKGAHVVVADLDADSAKAPRPTPRSSLRRIPSRARPSIWVHRRAWRKRCASRSCNSAASTS